jgi:apolipoprotein N-acyltransferase
MDCCVRHLANAATEDIMANLVYERLPEADRASNQLTQPTLQRPQWLALLLAAALLPVANGVNSVPLAAWLAPVFLLRFVRTSPRRAGLPITYALLMAAFAFQFRGMVPIPGVAYFIFLAISGIPMVLPYVADRWLTPKLRGMPATLVFPTMASAADFLWSLGPYASWGAVAYSQHGNMPLLQWLSVTGLLGIAFLIYWFAAVTNCFWEQGMGSPAARRGVWVFASILVLVLLGGGVRLAFYPPSANNVRVASLSRGTIQPEPGAEIWQQVLSGKATGAELTKFTTWANAVDDDLLARAEREAKAGAKIVFWGEANAIVFKESEGALIARGRELAARNRIYLGMALATWNQGQKLPLENKFILIEPSGQIAWDYYKAHPVPGPEAAMSVTTDGKLRSLDTPYGRLTSVICFDGDFPRLLAQAGTLKADTVLDPSNDWRAIDPWHTQMASFRAIEQGVNLVRQASFGLSAAYDYQGRQLAAMDHYRGGDLTLVSQIPTKGVRTVYSRFGDWFGWLCVAGAGAFMGAALRRQVA